MVWSFDWIGFSKGQHLHDMVVVESRVDEEEAAFLVFDEDRVDGKADLARGSAVPEDVIAVDHQRAPSSR